MKFFKIGNCYVNLGLLAFVLVEPISIHHSECIVVRLHASDGYCFAMFPRADCDSFLEFLNTNKM